MELNDGLGQHGVGRARRATEGLGALFHAKAQQIKALGVHLFPVGPRALVRLKHGRHVNAYLGQDIRLNDRGQVAVEVHLLGFLLPHLHGRATVVFNDDFNVRLGLWDTATPDDHLQCGHPV